MKTSKKRSQKQEKSVADSFSGRVTAASGALWGMKGDVRNEKFLIECKTTEKDFYTITTKVWEKIEEEALKDHMRTPLLIVDLKDTYRYVIFNPKQFEKQVNSYEVIPHVHGGIKSYKFSGGYTPVLFSLTAIKSHKVNHILMAMTLSEFEEYFKEELEC